jgi:hypothetical protein
MTTGKWDRTIREARKAIRRMESVTDGSWVIYHLKRFHISLAR